MLATTKFCLKEKINEINKIRNNKILRNIFSQNRVTNLIILVTEV